MDCAAHLVILDKHDQYIPFVPNRVQRDYRARRAGRDLILKARQLGISTLLQADGFMAAVSQTVRCATLAHDHQTTQMLRHLADRFWRRLPDFLRPERGLDNAGTTTYLTTGSVVTIGTAGSVHLGRGGTYGRVHGSEAAFWKDAESIMAGILQGVPTGGIIEIESSPNGAQGWFYEHCMKALDGDSDWRLHFYPWWWADEYRLPLHEPLALEPDEAALVRAYGLTHEQIAWRRLKQRELGRLFLQEYPEDPHTCFLSSSQSYFADIPHLQSCFSAPTDATPQPGHMLIGGLDFGQARDYTALSILDAEANEERELLRINRLSWGEMRARIVERCGYWHVTRLYAEANSMGATNIEELRRELAADSVATALIPFQTTAESKPPLIMGFHHALDQGGLKLLPSPEGQHEINTFVARQSPTGAWKYEAAEGGHDDTVIARALAWHGARRGGALLVFEV